MKLSFSNLALAGLIGFPVACSGFTFTNGAYHVFPGEEIQDALQAAARSTTNKLIKIHEGVYRPARKRQALIWFNQLHDGIRVEAVGNVLLTAANPELSKSGDAGYPSAVNHVVYFGDHISSNTVLKGFTIAGANNFVSRNGTKQIQPDSDVQMNTFFFTDGGGIKMFGRSYPTIDDVRVMDNYSSPCGAGVSVQHVGHNTNFATLVNCVFLRNRAQVTGSAVDLLEGSAARIINCLFVGNVSNTGVDVVSLRGGGTYFTNSGVLTIFQGSRALVRNCTFTGNRNAVDDMDQQSVYENSVFYKNDLNGAVSGTIRYELDLQHGAKVSGCLVQGLVLDPTHSVNATENVLDAPTPNFDANYVPRAAAYGKAGYRPTSTHLGNGTIAAPFKAP